jgi:hypothetical protein
VQVGKCRRDVSVSVYRRCFDTPTTKIRRHGLTSLINSEFTTGPVLALELDQALDSSAGSRMKGFNFVNRKFTHCLQKIGQDLAQAKAHEEKPSIAFMLMDNLG